MRWAIWGLLCLVGMVGLSRDGRTQTFTPGATMFPATAVGQSSQTVTVTLVAQAAGTAPTPVALTDGVAGLDFAVAAGGTCTAGVLLALGQSCTANVVFTPRFPGVRHGAVVLASGTQLLASTLISGVGQGGLPVLVPGEFNTVAGSGQWEYQGDGVAATSAPVFLPTGLAVDGAGDLYLSDQGNNRVRRVDAVTGKISTVAGNGSVGTAGDGGPATEAELNQPAGLALDGAGNLYIADSGNSTVRRVDAVTGQISTVAGRPGAPGFTGDAVAATSAELNQPQGVALTPGGDLVIADTGNNRVRYVDASTGQIQTIAGTGTAGFDYDGVSAVAAQLNQPWGVAVRSDGAIAVADTNNHRVRLVVVGGSIATIAGNGTEGYVGDNGRATQAELFHPAAVAFDPAGDLLIADSGNNRVRGVYGSPGTIITLTGNSSEQFGGDAGPANAASLYGPLGVVFDAQGNIWVSDMFHNRVRKIDGSQLAISYPTLKEGKTSAPVLETMYNAGNAALAMGQPVLSQAALDPATTTCVGMSLASTVFCNMGIEFAPTNVGPNVTGSVSWVSDAPNVTPVDQLNGQVLSVNPTTVAITSGENPGTLGQPVMLIATVSSDDTGRTGTVSFVEGNQTWCSGVPLAANGTAMCQIPSLSLGEHTFSANYSGDENNAASTSDPFTETVKQQPAVALGAPSTAVVTNSVVLTANVTDQQATGTPTGQVTFYDGATALATVALDANGSASWSTSGLAVGTHALKAQYAGDGGNLPGTSNTVNERVQQAATTTTVQSSANNVTVGTSVVFVARVVSAVGLSATGTVQFADGGMVLGSAALGSDGTASIAVATLAAGTHSVVVTYSGDTDDAASSSGQLAETVEQIATVTTVGADVNPSSAGGTVHLTAIVVMAPGAMADGALTGTVMFHEGNAVLGTAAVNSTGEASVAIRGLSVGMHLIVASFSGNTDYAASNSTGLSEMVQQTATSVALSSNAATALMGEAVSFTAVVTSATGVPTGTVVFKDGGTVLGSMDVDSHGSAVFSTTHLSVSLHAITAVYGGDANYLSASSPVWQQTVALAEPTLTLSGPTGAVDAGTNAAFRAVLTTPGVAPTGTLTFVDGGVAIGSQAVKAAGGFSLITAGLSVGAHTITASYSGDVNNGPVTSQAIRVVVQRAPSTTVLTSSANPLTQGAALTLAASVTSDSPNAEGGVKFYDGTTLLGTVALDGSGWANFSPQGWTLGTHNLTAVYEGDSNHAGSTSAVLAELVVQNSAVTLSSSVNPSVSGQNVTFTAQMTGTPTPTGMVSFRDNGALLATVPLNAAGGASFGTAELGVGTHTISVSYSGDVNFSPAAAQIKQTVNDATTQVTLSANANPATYGQPLQLLARVGSDGGAATGAVRFTDGDVVIGSAQLDADAEAVLMSSTLGAGAHTIVASYLGDGKASASVSAPLNEAVKQTTALAVSSSANPGLTLSAVSLTATLTNAGARPATGSVTFVEGATVLGSAALDGSGHATLALPELSAGMHSIVASYAGDQANFASQSAVFNQLVQLRPTLTKVTGTSTDATNPQQITLIALVKGDGSAAPSGMVTFTSGQLTLGAAEVDATGVAAITVVFETQAMPVVASYAGDMAYAASQSGATTISAGQAAQFTLDVSATNVTVVSHNRATVNVTLGSVRGFSDTIALGCLGLPYAATCTFDKSQLKLAADGSATASLVIDTGDPLGAGTSTTAVLERTGRGRREALMCLLPAGLLLGGMLRGRKRFGAVLVMLTGIVVAMGAVGCNGLQMSGTPAGTYSFKVIGTGQGSGATKAQTVTLAVTQ